MYKPVWVVEFPMSAAARCGKDQGLKALVNFSPVMLFMKGPLVGWQM